MGGVSYKGRFLSFDDVVEVAIFRQRLELRTVLVGSDFKHAISVLFGMRSGEQVRLTESPTAFSSGHPENVEKIQRIFDIVARESFQGRVRKYVAQLEAAGYYEYSGWRFYPAERKLISSKGRACPLADVTLLKSYGFIEVRLSAPTFLERVQISMSSPAGINTIKDTDVFYALLNHYFGLKWKGED